MHTDTFGYRSICKFVYIFSLSLWNKNKQENDETKPFHRALTTLLSQYKCAIRSYNYNNNIIWKYSVWRDAIVMLICWVAFCFGCTLSCIFRARYNTFDVESPLSVPMENVRLCAWAKPTSELKSTRDKIKTATINQWVINKIVVIDLCANDFKTKFGWCVTHNADLYMVICDKSIGRMNYIKLVDRIDNI